MRISDPISDDLHGYDEREAHGVFVGQDCRSKAAAFIHQWSSFLRRVQDPDLVR